MRSQRAATRSRRRAKPTSDGVTRSLARRTPSFHGAARSRSGVMRFHHGAARSRGRVMRFHHGATHEHIGATRELHGATGEVIDASADLHGFIRDLPWIQPKHDGASDESTCFFRHLSGAGDSFDGSAPKTIDGGRYPIAASNRSIDFSQSSMGACARTYAFSSAPTTISLAPSFFGRPIIFIARNRSFFRSLAPAACVTPQVRGARAPAGGLSRRESTYRDRRVPLASAARATHEDSRKQR